MTMPQTDSSAAPKYPTRAAKLVGFAVAAALLAIFVSSVFYRMENPARVQVRSMPPSAPSMGAPAPEHGDVAGPSDGAGGAPTMPPSGMGGMGAGGKGQAGGPSMEDIRALMRELQASPDDPETLIELSERFMRMGAWGQARAFLDTARQVVPDDPRVLADLGLVNFQSGDYQQAADAYTKLLEMQPNNAMAHFNLGILQKHYLDQPEEGAANLQKVLELNPSDTRLKEMVTRELEGPQEGQ